MNAIRGTRWKLSKVRLIPPILGGLIWCAAPALGGEGIDEYRVKAAFVYNFAKFVEWPLEAFTDPSDSLSICVLGDRPFAQRLRLLVKDQSIGPRSLAVREVTSVTVSHCQILFISDSEWKRARSSLKQLADAPVLTVGESDKFVESGGVINFKLKDDRIRIEIATVAAVRAKLRISAKLLSLADTVSGPSK